MYNRGAKEITKTVTIAKNLETHLRRPDKVDIMSDLDTCLLKSDYRLKFCTLKSINSNFDAFDHTDGCYDDITFFSSPIAQILTCSVTGPLPFEKGQTVHYEAIHVPEKLFNNINRRNILNGLVINVAVSCNIIYRFL
ncbi:Hypothetical predicted protein [Octopus vulgaris]|uniref:Uncharacterized protein n=1 Tax=Octopus vulgaris TaxID=6645 RepID=A0AA36FCA4_OCTVU|nr:Hypothetical predicted protein [Octopus vulgaris]